MGIRNDLLNQNNDYDYERITGEEKVDVQEMLSRQKSNTLWSNYRLSTENEELKPLFENILKNNDLSLLFKGIERFLCKTGLFYIAWDIFSAEEFGGTDKVVLLYPGYPASANQTMRLAQGREFAGIIEIEPTSNKQGVRQRVRQLRTQNETEQLVLVSAISETKFPIDVFYLKTPKFLKLFINNGIRTHNYGVLSMRELLNKNIVDFNGRQDYLLPDDYPVKHLRNMINGMLRFYKMEQVKNSTKWVGTFGSYNDGYQLNDKEARIVHLMNSGNNQAAIDQLANSSTYKKTILQSDYIIPTSGANFSVDKLQSTFNGEEISRAITSLLEIYFNGSGMDFAMQSMSGASQYVNDAGIQTQNRRTTETIKEAIVLREQQYGDIIKDIIDAWFGQKDYHKKFDGDWEFKVLSNIVNEEQYGIDKIVLMKENFLISDEVAIKKANKDMNRWELDKMIASIEKEKKEAEQLEQKQEMLKEKSNE